MDCRSIAVAARELFGRSYRLSIFLAYSRGLISREEALLARDWAEQHSHYLEQENRDA